ncbi:MAG: MATE family efflux transporter [Velocimicrobium sp.]
MKKYIGDKKFYSMVLLVAVPIMIQNGITNFVGLLDNIMVGQIGTEQMTGVAITNQLMFVFNICIFGGISGASIFGTQFFGNRNFEGFRNTFRFKIGLSALFVIVGVAIFFFGGNNLIKLYLHQGSSVENLDVTLQYGKRYLLIMLIGMLPYAASQVYSSTLRETGETVLPMKAGIVAVVVNLIFNYILIFGKFGMPALGVEGAAIATVISRYVEALITIIWTHINKKKNEFIIGVYHTLRVPANLGKHIILRGMPLMLNEAMWASGMAIMTQCYSVRGLSVMAGINISSTISNLFNVVFIALGGAVAVIVGQLLGAGKMEEAKDTDRKLIFFSVMSCVFIGIGMAIMAPFFPRLYNTTQEVKSLATNFIIISALCMPIYAFTHASYFTLRSGGKTVITFIFDSCFIWVFSIPLAFYLTRFTDWNIIHIYLYCQLIELIKCVIGFVLVKKGVWIHNIVVEE